MAKPVTFDRLARVYRPLEWIAFGRTLERARTAHLDALADARRALVIGDGDGLALARLLRIAPCASVHAIDTSAAMLERAASRLDDADRHRVTFEQADVRTFVARGPYDAITTLFVLDCLTSSDAAAVVARLSAELTPGGCWLWADFVEPPTGWRRLRARLLLRFLYWFFRMTTNLQVREVPPAEQLLDAAGLEAVAVTELEQGLIRSVLFRRPAAR